MRLSLQARAALRICVGWRNLADTIDILPIDPGDGLVSDLIAASAAARFYLMKSTSWEFAQRPL